MGKWALRPTVISVEPMANYHLRLAFDNGERGVLDVRPYIRGDWYGKLADPAVFNSVRTDGWTLVWPGGQDLCPDCVYDETVMEK